MKQFTQIRAELQEKAYRPTGSMSQLGNLVAQAFKKHVEKAKMSQVDEKKLTKMWGDWCSKKGSALVLDYISKAEKKAKLEDGSITVAGMKGKKFGKFVKEPSYSTEKQDYYLLSNDFVVMIQGPTDAKELKNMTKAMKGSYKSTEAGTLDGLLGGDAKFGPGPTIEIRDTFGIIIDDK
jgi:hypothetical protein